MNILRKKLGEKKYNLKKNETGQFKPSISVNGTSAHCTHTESLLLSSPEEPKIAEEIEAPQEKVAEPTKPQQDTKQSSSSSKNLKGFRMGPAAKKLLNEKEDKEDQIILKATKEKLLSMKQ